MPSDKPVWIPHRAKYRVDYVLFIHRILYFVVGLSVTRLGVFNMCLTYNLTIVYLRVV